MLEEKDLLCHHRILFVLVGYYFAYLQSNIGQQGGRAAVMPKRRDSTEGTLSLVHDVVSNAKKFDYRASNLLLVVASMC